MHPTKGDREDKERRPKFKPKVHKPKGVIRGRRTNYVPKPPPIIRSILEKKREGNLESVVNLRTFTCNNGTPQNKGSFCSL
jgi:hypothetical protein